MIVFAAGVIAGILIGMAVMCLLVAAGDADRNEATR